MDKQNWIAIVGMALRFPGADNKFEFWENLCSGKDSIETLSVQELIARGADPDDVAKPNYVRRVSRMRNPEMFDAGYFSMTKREAQLADPQLRVLLEVCQEAIDDSAHVLGGTNTGVFVGAADNDFWVSQLIYNHPDRIGASLGSRVLAKKDYIATQLSHKLNLTGPSFNINTACSTSSVAVHEAVTHLLMYECDFAIAGGCEIDQGLGYLYEEGSIDSRDGFCRAFDARASGTIFASGCGILILRRYEEAVADGDRIYGVIVGSRINNDGRQKAGFTAPSVVGQSKVIHEALSTAGIGAEQVSYIEAHGTGTLVGDPIEIEALTQAFRQFTDRRQFCAIGTVKTNVGHLSIAAGVAGIIKTTLALERKQVPPSLHFDEPNPGIDFGGSPFRVVTRLENWTTDGAPRIAGVSSFGVGGTNSHIILREAPEPRASGASRAAQLIAISAKSEDALARMQVDIEKRIRGCASELELADIAYTLQVGRPELSFRSIAVIFANSAANGSIDWVNSDGAVEESAKRQVSSIAVDSPRESQAALLRAIGSDWVKGISVDWSAFWKNQIRNRTSLPAYPFDRKRYWIEPRGSQERKRPARASLHPLLGQRWSQSAKVATYDNDISPANPDFLGDHRLSGTTIFPGAAYVEMALAAARLRLGNEPVRIENIRFERALMLADSELRHLQTVVYEAQLGSWNFEIGCQDSRVRHDGDIESRLHSSGSFRSLRPADIIESSIDLSALRRRIEERDSLDFYKYEAIAYGPKFRGLSQLWIRGDEILGRVELPIVLQDTASQYRFHPVLLDSCFQAIGALTARMPGMPSALPVGLMNFDLYGNIPQAFWVHISCERVQGSDAASDGIANIAISMIADDGKPLGRIESYRRKSLTSALPQSELPDDLHYEIAWVEQAVAVPTAEEIPDLLVFTDDVDDAHIAAMGSAARRITVHDYSSCHDLEAAVNLAIGALQNASARLEVAMMRISRRADTVETLCDVLLRIVKTIAADSCSASVSLSVVTRGCQSVVGSSIDHVEGVSGAALWGMASAIRKEYSELSCRRIDLDPHANFDAALLATELTTVCVEDCIAYRGVTRYAARLRRMEFDAALSNRFKIGTREFGTFDGLSVEALGPAAPLDDEVEVELVAAGLNFKETLITLGMLGTQSPEVVRLGFEGSGRVARVGANVRDVDIGAPVIVWANGCLASHITVHREKIIRFDSSILTYEQAASLPTVFMTAYFALHVLAKIRKGDRILIHAAAGGVGQAAIQIARAAGAEIYATASRGKWAYLARQGIDRVFDSRDVNFGDELLRASGGRGVDIVLNSLTGDFIQKGFDVLSPNGRFIEIGKLNIWSEERARRYRPDVAYHAFELGVGPATGSTQPPLEAWLRPVLNELDQGSFDCPPVRVFPVPEVAAAFRWLAAGRNIGKAVVKLNDRENKPIGAFASDKQYLVSGGLGALGIRIAKWLSARGAREIILLGRNAPSESVERELNVMRERGVVLTVKRCDVAARDEVASVIDSLPGLAGVFHCAGVLDDGALLNLTRERFDRVLRPKVTGVQVLHESTQGLPLDMFVLFSSTSSLLDGAGQANYAAANAYLDSFALYRRNLGLPALSVGWGGWAETGMAAELVARRPGLDAELLSPPEALAALDRLLSHGKAAGIVTRLDGRLARVGNGTGLYAELAPARLSQEKPAEQKREAASTEVDARATIAESLRHEVGLVLGSDELRDTDDFIEAGIDSLMLAELRNKVQKSLAKKIPMAAFLANPSIAALTDYILDEHYRVAPATVAEPRTIRANIIELNGVKHGSALFCIPGVGDNIFDFKFLAAALDRPVRVLRLRDEPNSDAFVPDEITFMAEGFVAAIKHSQGVGPYSLVGYSFGGSIALEAARQLRAMGEFVDTVTLLDSVPSFKYRDDIGYRRFAYMTFFATLLESLAVSEGKAREFYELAADHDTQGIVRTFREMAARFDLPAQLDGRGIDALIQLFTRRSNIPYVLRHPNLGNTRVTLFKAAAAPAFARRAGSIEQFPRFRQDASAYGWEEMVDARIEVVSLDCTHAGILKPPFIDAIASSLHGCIDDARRVAMIDQMHREQRI